MSNNKDYIPHAYLEYNDWFENFVAIVGLHTSGGTPDWPHVTEEAKEGLFIAHGSWQTAFSEAKMDPTNVKKKERARVQESSTAVVRVFVNDYLRRDPVTEEQRDQLGVRTPKKKRSKVPIPKAQCIGEVFTEGLHMVFVNLVAYIQALTDDERAAFGVRIYYGLMPPGGANIEQAAGPHHLLMHVPTVGEDLSLSRFTHKQKNNVFDFNGFSGMTAYFCCRFENGRGDVGPFGPIFSIIVT